MSKLVSLVRKKRTDSPFKECLIEITSAIMEKQQRKLSFYALDTFNFLSLSG